MAWRGVHISQPCRLTCRDGQLVVTQEAGEVALAIEDIACVVLDTPQLTITGYVLSALADKGVVMIVPDATHHPAGVLLPFHRHHAQAHVAHMQTGMSQPLKKRLWQALVIAKIRNQAGVLQQLGRPQAKALSAMVERVGSGDPDNIEAQAARMYWQDLFTDFTRANDQDRRNVLLNYGYAVVRAALARACVAAGLLPAFGIHHASRSNAFNLVDDLIEPFRPFVDRAAYNQAEAAPGAALTVEDRRCMAGILHATVAIGAEQISLLVAAGMVAMSVVRAMEYGSTALLQTPSWPDSD